MASALVGHFSGGISFVSLSSLSDSRLLASEIVQMMGIREVAGKSPLEMLKGYLQDLSRAPILLLLDNFEHLLPAAPVVADILAMGPNLKILVTSRAALHV